MGQWFNLAWFAGNLMQKISAVINSASTITSVPFVCGGIAPYHVFKCAEGQEVGKEGGGVKRPPGGSVSPQKGPLSNQCIGSGRVVAALPR